MNNGGPAFPVTDSRYGYDGEHLGLECTDTGMSLRDWFAGQALAGLLSTSQLIIQEEGGVIYEPVASVAYSYADAMLAEREKNNERENRHVQ